MRGVPLRQVALDLGPGLLLGWLGWLTAAFTSASTVDGPLTDRRGPGSEGGFDRGFDRGFGQRALEVPPTLTAMLVLVVVGVALRRVAPRLGFVVTVVGLGGYLAAGGPLGPVFLALTVTVLSMAVALPLRRWVGLLGLLVPLTLADHWGEAYLGLLDPGLYAGGLALAAVAVLPSMFALLRRARRESDRREREQDLRRSVDEERLRIAREVHDVVGHSLSVITLQAGVALHVLERRPDQAAASLEAIRTTSRSALDELRTTLAVFREADGAAPLGPRPGLARLEDLIGALTAAGRQVRLERSDVDPAALPVAVDQAAFRIVQEALTNVVRHAGPAQARVRLEQRPDRLRLEVADDGVARSLPVEGSGLRGMRERAAAVGGRLDLRVGDPAGLVVTADLPLGEGTR